MIHRGSPGTTILVTFEVPAAVGASSASVCGDFNDWSFIANPLSPLEDGSFRGTVELPAGRRWHFRYLLDGHRWENDWEADDYAPNMYGGQDSVVDLSGAYPSPSPLAMQDLAAGGGPVDGAER
jgi:1,4-alpha-glucan branching enzyme